MLETPILFLIFNRPDTTQKVFSKIKEAKPKQLFIAADGPRTHVPDDIKKCRQTREIATQVDWDCEVKTLFREENLGCKYAVSLGISWFFEQVDAGIILEDDVLPDNSFFSFCQQMLDQYKNDQRVMMITGLNVCGKWKENIQDYHFSYYGGIWGWASWKRAWKYYDVDIKQWADPNIKRLLLNFFPLEVKKARQAMYDALYEGKTNTWDLQWTFAKILNSGLSIIPSHNLIRNIGCNMGGTHVTGNHPWANLTVKQVRMPMSKNPIVISDVEYDFNHLGLNGKNESSKIKKPFKNLKSLQVLFKKGTPDTV